MKTIVGVESFDDLRNRSLARARLLDKGERIKPERRITFETAEDMLACLTPHRLRVIEAARQRPQSVTDLAASVSRNRSSVQRDITVLSKAGLLRLSKRSNPGHGRVQIVEAIAEHFTLTAVV